MFRRKTDKTSPNPAPAAKSVETAEVRKPQKIASIIANDITVEGNVSGDGELHVDGVIRGDVRVLRLSIGRTGQIEGAIVAEMVENRGRVVGSITARHVRLVATSLVDGDITHDQLTIETGASFQGRSLKFQRPAPAAAKPTSAEVVDLARRPNLKGV